LKYYIPYALVVEEKKKKQCVRAHTYTIGKKKRRKSVRLLACSLALLSRARAIHFCEQAREHKWPCMYHDGMRDVVRRRKGWKGTRGKRERESERSKKTEKARTSDRVI